MRCFTEDGDCLSIHRPIQYTCRVQTDTFFYRYQIDLGASFVHGCHDDNPLFRMANSLNLKLDTSEGGYSAGWLNDAPWYDVTGDGLVSRKSVRKAFALAQMVRLKLNMTPAGTPTETKYALTPSAENTSEIEYPPLPLQSAGPVRWGAASVEHDRLAFLQNTTGKYFHLPHSAY